MNFRKIKKSEFDKLKRLFPGNDEMWEKYRKMRLEQFETQKIDVFVIENDGNFIGEMTVCYKNQELEQETIPNMRVYFEAFRVEKKYQGQGLGQKLISYCVEHLQNLGYTEFTIGVEEDNETAKHIYFKLGFDEPIAYGHGDEFDPSEYTLYLRRPEIHKKIEKLVKEEGLGNSVKNITSVTGGLSHRMYKVETNAGVYAVKELNPAVMKRPEAYSNFVFSEKVTDIAKKNGIPAIGAVKLGNGIMRKIDNIYFMVFEWLDGKILKAEEITEEHCRIIGEILAKIHNIDFSEIEEPSRKNIGAKKFDWGKYIDLAKRQNQNFADILEQNADLLEKINEKSKESLEYAREYLVISHTDLDRKNVMWQENMPFIIDWEASGYVNPTIELIQVAWYWSGGDVENIDYAKFETVVKSYKEYAKKKIDENVGKLIYADIYNGFEWLDYNCKRALCIENVCDKDEIELAENEILQSIQKIKYNVSQMEKIVEIFEKV